MAREITGGFSLEASYAEMSAFYFAAAGTHSFLTGHIAQLESDLAAPERYPGEAKDIRNELERCKKELSVIDYLAEGLQKYRDAEKK